MLVFKLPYFLEGISNIFKPVLTSEGNIDDTKGAENYRGKLTFDSNTCIGCGICIRVCAGDAISKDVQPIEGGQEITMNFDLTSCTFCGLCKDFCPKKAIELTDEVMMVTCNKDELKIGGTFIKKLPPKPAPKPKVATDAKENVKPKSVVEDEKVKKN